MRRSDFFKAMLFGPVAARELLAASTDSIEDAEEQHVDKHRWEGTVTLKGYRRYASISSTGDLPLSIIAATRASGIVRLDGETLRFESDEDVVFLHVDDGWVIVEAHIMPDDMLEEWGAIGWQGARVPMPITHSNGGDITLQWSRS